MVRKTSRLLQLSQILVIGLLLPVTFLFLDSSELVDFRQSFSRLYEKVFFQSHQQISKWQDAFGNLSLVWEDKLDQQTTIHALERQVASQKVLLDHLAGIERENARLNGLLELSERLDFSLVFSRIIGYDPENHFVTLVLDKGSEDGLRENMPVLAYQDEQVALVGFVFRTDARTSEIHTILDQRTQVSTQFADEDSFAIAHGQSSASLLLAVEFIDIRLENILYKELYTSGLGERYSSGILVGHLVEVEVPQYGLFQEALLRPAIDFYTLREVIIMLENKDIPSEFNLSFQLNPNENIEELESIEGQ